MVKICVSLGNCDFQLLKSLVSKYEFYELRLDLLNLSHNELRELLKINKNAVVTLRENSKVISTKKLDFFKLAIGYNVSFIDLEFDLDYFEKEKIYNLIDKSQTKVILSQHYNNQLCFTEIERDYQAMLSDRADIIKLITKFSDKALINQTLSLNNYKTIAFSMGDLGSYSRYECIRIGSPFTYSRAEELAKTADGQLSYSELKHILYYDKFEIYGVMGFPISHSLSPTIFNPHLTQKSVYLKILAKSFFEIFELNKVLPIKIINVTSPHKKAAFNFSNIKSKSAENLGMANILEFGNKIISDNTDPDGVELCLKHIDFNNISRIIILGAGGAAKSVLFALERYDHEKIILNRTLRNAKTIAGKNQVKYDYLSNLEDFIIDDSLIINTLPRKVELSLLKTHKAIFFNANYNDDVFKNKISKYFTTYIDGEKWLLGQAIPLAKRILNSESILVGKRKPNLERIALLGFMGAGKSHAGRHIAKKLRWKWIDIDHEIEISENMKISEIFRLKGERYFRELESKILQLYAHQRKIVVSTGGGIIESESNIATIRERFYSYWLLRDLDITYNKLNTNNRPKVQDHNNFEKLFFSRISKYARSCDVLTLNNDIKKTIENIYEDYTATYKFF